MLIGIDRVVGASFADTIEEYFCLMYQDIAEITEQRQAHSSIIISATWAGFGRVSS